MARETPVRWRILRQNVGEPPDVPAIVSDRWICPTCRGAADTLYCPTCGERRRDPRELSLAGLAGQVFEALTSVDGRLLRSFRTLIAATGSLSHAAAHSFFAFSRKYLRLQLRPQTAADSDADRFSSSTYRIARVALMKASQPCS